MHLLNERAFSDLTSSVVVTKKVKDNKLAFLT